MGMRISHTNDPAPRRPDRENYITFLKLFDSDTGEFTYKVRLYDQGRVQIPVSLGCINGCGTAIIFNLVDGEEIPEDDFIILLKGAAGYIFEIVLHSGECQDPEQTELLHNILAEDNALDKMAHGESFETEHGRFTPINVTPGQALQSTNIKDAIKKYLDSNINEDPNL